MEDFALLSLNLHIYLDVSRVPQSKHNRVPSTLIKSLTVRLKVKE